MIAAGLPAPMLRPWPADILGGHRPMVVPEGLAAVAGLAGSAAMSGAGSRSGGTPASASS